MVVQFIDSIFAVIAATALAIAIHELGHLGAALYWKVGITRISLGIGPPILRRYTGRVHIPTTPGAPYPGPPMGQLHTGMTVDFTIPDHPMDNPIDPTRRPALAINPTPRRITGIIREIDPAGHWLNVSTTEWSLRLFPVGGFVFPKEGSSPDSIDRLNLLPRLAVVIAGPLANALLTLLLTLPLLFLSPSPATDGSQTAATHDPIAPASDHQYQPASRSYFSPSPHQAHNWTRLLFYSNALTAIINLLPIPSLDGAWVAYTLIDRYSRRGLSRQTATALNLLGLVAITTATVIALITAIATTLIN